MNRRSSKLRSLPRIAALLAAIGLASGCSGASSKGAPDSAEAAESVAGVLTLADVLPEAQGLGISDARVRKLFDKRFNEIRSEFEENKYYLEVTFPSLGQAQFDGLMKLFGGHSRVTFTPGKAYELSDFLHPAMQALGAQTYEGIGYVGASDLTDLLDLFPEGGTDEQIRKRDLFAALWHNEFWSQANCYNTSAELVRMMHPAQGGNMDMFLYLPDRFQADGWFGGGLRQSLNLPESDAFSRRVDDAQVAFGDVLVVRAKNRSFSDYPLLAHTAIVLSQKLLFEKTDSSRNDPYRVSLRADVVKMYERKFADTLVLDYRRFNGEGTQPIPAPKLPTGEIPDDGIDGSVHRMRERIKSDYPDLKIDNVTLSTDEGFGVGAIATNPSEIEPATVVIDSNGRGTLHADSRVLARFTRLKDESP